MGGRHIAAAQPRTGEVLHVRKLARLAETLRERGSGNGRMLLQGRNAVMQKLKRARALFEKANAASILATRKLFFLVSFFSLPALLVAQSVPRHFNFALPNGSSAQPAISAERGSPKPALAKEGKAGNLQVRPFSIGSPIGPPVWQPSSLTKPISSLSARRLWISPNPQGPGLGRCILLKTQPCPPAVPDFADLAGKAQLPDANPLLSQASSRIPAWPFRVVQPPGATEGHIPSSDPRKPPTTPKKFILDILGDQPHIWKFPWEVAHGHHWQPVLAFTLATAGLVALDPHDTPYFRRTNNFSGFNGVFASQSTGLSEGLFPLGFLLAGHVLKDTYMENTAWLAGEALVDSEIVSQVMKDIARRARPRDIPPYGDFSDSWYGSNGNYLLDSGSFPSGHSIGAFSIATIIAERYHRHRWVPWVAYGLAAAIGFSRVTLRAHFPSDVFAGAALGYAVSHYVVLRNRQ